MNIDTRVETYSTQLTEKHKSMLLDLSGFKIWFSNGDPIAFRGPGDTFPTVLATNGMTGVSQKHASWIDTGKLRALKRRLEKKAFDRAFQEALRDNIMTTLLEIPNGGAGYLIDFNESMRESANRKE